MLVAARTDQVQSVSHSPGGSQYRQALYQSSILPSGSQYPTGAQSVSHLPRGSPYRQVLY